MITEEFHRKLTAILSADVVGYSRLMGDDEAATVKILETYKGVMSSLIRQHRGRVVDSPGDNLLAEFGSVVDAVQCAVSIQKELQARNTDLPENRRMEFRIGINLGDVIEEEDRLYGDGVNIAARLEALADPGGICISKTAFDYIENKLPFGYRFIGEQTVKNIAKPIGAYKVLMETRLIGEEEQKAKASFWRRKAVLSLGIIVILAIAAVLYWNFYLRGPTIEPASTEPEQAPAISDVEKAKKTIAVLPFEDLSPESDQRYFVDGLSEEILNSLAQIPDLTVIARTSSFSFKGTNKTIQEIAGVLGVENILEGSVRKAGNALRITAQLVKAVDGSHLWSKTYDRELKDIFAVQEDIATAVADELKVTLGIGKSLKRLGGTDNVKAYELYLIAQSQLDNFEIERALTALDEALKIDPEFALAWASKASIFANDYPGKGIQAALKSIELEPNMAEGYAALGRLKTNAGEWDEAQSALRKALELAIEPSITILTMNADFYFIVGYFDKVRGLLEKAMEKDPLNVWTRFSYITYLGVKGDIRRAEEEDAHCRILLRDLWDANANWAITWVRLGSGEVISRDRVRYSDPITDTAKEYLGLPKEGLLELRRILNEDKNLTDGNLNDISIWAAYFDDPEFAMDAMERAYSKNASRMGTLWYPVMHEVRQTPRFKEYIKKIGLVGYWNKFGWPDICHKLDDGDFVCD